MLYTLRVPIFINCAREALLGRYEYIPIRPYIKDVKPAKPGHKSETSSLMIQFIYESDFMKKEEKFVNKYLKVIAFSEIPRYAGINFKYLGTIIHAKRKPYYIYGKITTI